MTQGSETNGECICTHTEDSRCAEIDRSKLPHSFCSWVTHFVNWLRAEFPLIQFDVSDLSRSSNIASVFHRLNFSDPHR
jgi:hypothetical protein